jgi:predicted dehydrogenase
MTAPPRDGGQALRVGLAGYGLAGAVFHAPLIAADPALSLVGVVTRDPSRVSKARADHPGVTVVDDVVPLLDLDLDLLVVATTNATHVPLARAAIDAQVSVVIDKPMAPTAAEARELVNEARSAGVLLTTFQNRRWDSDFLTLQALVGAGTLGDVHRFESRFERWRPALGGGWRERDDPGAAGGLLFDLGSHLIDQALILLGPVVSVYAEIDRRRSPDAADDDVFVALEHASGGRSHLWASAVAGSPGPRFRVLGSAAAYVVDGLDGQEEALRAGARPAPGWGTVAREAWGELVTGEERVPVASLSGNYPAFYGQLAQALTNSSAEPPVDPLDSVRGLEIIEAARQSAKTRTVVPHSSHQP